MVTINPEPLNLKGGKPQLTLRGLSAEKYLTVLQSKHH
jgi:hypothetical protein